MREAVTPTLGGSLHCTLLDRRSSIALADARITCVWRDGRMTRYDADRLGSFRTSLPQGAYDLVISARGYLSLVVRGVGVLEGFEHVVTRALVPGQGQSEESAPATAVGGYIRDRLGRGIAGLTVRLSGDSGATTYSAGTSRDGAYVINGVAPNRYTVEVMAHERRLSRTNLAIADTRDFERRDLRLVTL